MPVEPAPSPVGAGSVDELSARLRALRAWAGEPSFTEVARRVGALRSARGVPEQRPGRVTVYDVFRPGRTRLDVELLADVVRALGLGDDDVAAWRAAYRTASGGAPAPAPAGSTVDVVAAPRRVVGRDDVVARLADALASSPGVVTVAGLPGSGTTTVAAAVAHRLAGDVVRVDLRGAGGGPAPSAPVLDALLQALGAPAPTAEARDVDRLATRLGTVLRGRGTVVVLDGAHGTAHAAELVAFLPAARVVVTSRRSLDLPRAGAATLGPLGTTAAVELLAATVGPDRVAAEPDAAARLALACGLLPAALVAVAEQVATRPSWSLADHARRVEDLPAAALHPALATAHAALDPDHARALRLLALHPAPLDVPAAALLLGVGDDAAGATLRALADGHLLDLDADGRAAPPAPVRDLAADLARADDPFSGRAEAAARLAGPLVEQARRAVVVAAPHHAGPAPDVSPAETSHADASPATALAWLDAHRGLLVGTATLAAEHELADAVTDLSALLAPYLDSGGHWLDAVAVHAAAADSGREAGRSQAGRDLGRALERLGRYDEALAHLVRSLERGDDPRPGQTLNRIGNVYKRLGRFADAETSYRDAAAASRTVGDPVSEARAVGNLADVHRILGRRAEAHAGYDRAVRLSARVGDVLNVATVSGNAAILHEVEGDLARALDLQRDVLASAERLGDAGLAVRTRLQVGRLLARTGDPAAGTALLRDAVDEAVALEDPDAEAEARTALGEALLAAGAVEEAVASCEAALGAARRVRSRLAETAALNGLGDALLAAGDVGRAATTHDGALAAATALDDAPERARALRGLGDGAAARGDDRAARTLWARALAVYDAAGHPDAATVRARLG